MWKIWELGTWKEYDVMGFCHYRRQFYEHQIKKYEPNDVLNFSYTEVPLKLFIDRMACNFLYNDFLDYVKSNYKPEDYEYKLYVEGSLGNAWSICECFICPIRVYSRMVPFISGWLKWIDKKYSLEFKKENYKNFIDNTWVNSDEKLINTGVYDFFGYEKNPDKNKQQYRIIAYMIEIILGMYVINYPGTNNKHIFNKIDRL